MLHAPCPKLPGSLFNPGDRSDPFDFPSVTTRLTQEKTRENAGFLGFSCMAERMGRDSNPRWNFSHCGFQDRRNRPLCHPSKRIYLAIY